MPFKDKPDQGLLGTLFNKKKPQPSTIASSGTKTIVADEDGGVSVAPKGGDAPSDSLFASRRNARPVKPVEEPIDVDAVEVRIAPRSRPNAEVSSPVIEPVAQDVAVEAVSEAGPEAKPAAGLFAKSAEAPKKQSFFKPKEKLAPSSEKDERADAGVAKTKEKPAPTSFFKKKDKEAGAPSAAKSSGTVKKEMASKKEPTVRTVAVSELTLVTELENGKSLFWMVGKNSLVQKQEVPAQAEVVSFSREDLRFRPETALSFGKAQELAIQDIGEMVSVVNRSKDLRVVYATREQRATEAPYRIAPGQQNLDMLLKKTGRVGQSLVTGFKLEGAEGGPSIAVLYHVTEDGESSKPQITVNPDNMEFVLSQFTTARKINRKDVEIVLFTNEDLLSVAGGLQYFANEKVWNGIPVRVLYDIGAAVSGVAAAGAVMWAGWGYWQQESFKSDMQRTQVGITALNIKNNKLISSSMQSFASHLSLDQSAMFKVAEQIWVPSSRVSVEMRARETVFTVSMPLTNNANYNNRPSTESTVPNAAVEYLYAKPAPEGCVKGGVSSAGGLNEVRVTIVCDSATTPFTRFMNDMPKETVKLGPKKAP